MYKPLTFVLFAVILSSLSVPAFAELSSETYFITYPNCASLEGFGTNANDSTNSAKACFDNTIVPNPNNNKISDSRMTLTEITMYCSQFNVDVTLEKNCINDYVTVDELKLDNILVFISIIIFGIGFFILGLWFMADGKNIRLYLGATLLIISLILMLAIPHLRHLVHPPLA